MVGLAIAGRSRLLQGLDRRGDLCRRGLCPPSLRSPDGAGSYKDLTAEAIFVGGGSVPRASGCGSECGTAALGCPKG